jgi:hypothetical protein
MAGQRGAGANEGLMARQAAMQGGANQQNAAGQAATMQANQSLNAMGQLAGIAGQQAQQGIGAQQAAAGIGAQQVGQGQTATGQQAALLGQQANIAGTQVGQQQAGINAAGNLGLGLTAAQQAAQNAQGNFITGANSNATTQAGQQIQSQTSQNVAGSKAGSGLVGGVINGIGSALMADGGQVTGTPAEVSPLKIETPPSDSGSNPLSSLAPALADAAMAQGGNVSMHAHNPNGPKSMIGRHQAGGLPQDHVIPHTMAQGGKVPAMLSPGEKYLSPKAAQEVAEGRKSPMDGKTVPGKAKVKGDSLKNDTVPATLEEGGIVIPRSVLESKNPHEEAAKFVAAHLSKMKAKK